MRTLLPFLLLSSFAAAEGGANPGGEAGADPGKGEGGATGQEPARGGQGAGAGTVTMTRAELDALVKGAVEKETGPLRSQVETWQKAALDSTWNEVYRTHGLDPEVGALARERWEAIKPEEGQHRPDPAEWAPAQKWFGKLKPAAPPAEPQKTSGKAAAQVVAEAKPPVKAPAAPADSTIPAYLSRGPGQAAAPPAAPATTTRAGLQVAVEAARAAEGLT